MHYRPNEFADLAGVSVKTLHRWDSSGKLKPLRTIGGHHSKCSRRFSAKNHYIIS
ncbi:MAG: MerR family DNA-binding transcriptional regulator [Trichodesmium sp. MAG_R02]|nr:MerR family DNA-binding transcriptional regulator [Trichodesmium sp. MAG_R02]